MTNKELEAAYTEARKEFQNKNPNSVYFDETMLRLSRYFFWAGSTFGIQAAQAIYRESTNVNRT